MKTRIGCSGWHYDEWVATFYPENLDSEDWLHYYSERFDTVEVNNSFYQLPEQKTMQQWLENTAEDFVFTLKGSRQVTHLKKLNEVEEPVKEFYDHVETMGEKLGCVLWQLHPILHGDEERLENFCKTLSGDFRNVIEFRHESWFEEPFYDILREYEVGFCMISAPEGLPETTLSTTDYAYLRFHGKAEEWYQYDYNEKELREWKERLEKLKVEEGFIYFNNTYQAYAVENALTMREMMEGEVPGQI